MNDGLICPYTPALSLCRFVNNCPRPDPNEKSIVPKHRQNNKKRNDKYVLLFEDFKTWAFDIIWYLTVKPFATKQNEAIVRLTEYTV